MDSNSSNDDSGVAENTSNKRKIDSQSENKNKRTKVDPKILDGKFYTIKLRNGDKVQAICNLCGSIRSGSINGTGNFTRHINDKHSERASDMYEYLAYRTLVSVNANGKLIQSKLSSNVVISSDKIKDLLLNVIVHANLPFRIVQSTELKTLLDAVAGREVAMPSIPSTMVALDSRFNQVKNRLKILINEVQYVCLTADVWSHMRKSYLGVSIHLIANDNGWSRKSYILAFRFMTQRQTFDYLAETLVGIFKEYNLPIEKITHIVTDGGSNFCKAFREYGKKSDFSSTLALIEQNEEEYEGDNENDIVYIDGNPILVVDSDDNLELSDDIQAEIHRANIQGDQINFPNENDEIDMDIILPPQMRCFAHLLNLIGKVDLLQELENYTQTNSAFIAVYSKLKKFWNLAARSTSVNTLIQNIMECSVKTPAVTRWNSEYDSMEDAYNKRCGINDVCRKLSESGQLKFKEFSNMEWNIVHDYVQLMKPIAISLDKLQGEKNVSLGSVLPCLYYIKKEFTRVNLKTSDSNILKVRNIGSDMKNAIQKVFDKRFSVMMEFSPANKELILAAISHPVYKMKWIEEEHNIAIARNYFEQEMMKLSTPREYVIQELDGSDDEFICSDILSSTRRVSSDNNSANEIFNFLDDRDKNISMLSKYFTIGKVFKKFNTTLSSSAPIERLFSQALIVCTPRRNRISSANFEKILLAKTNKDLID